MPLITPRNISCRDGHYQVTVYRGSAADATDLGVRRMRHLDGDATVIEHWLGTRRIQIGARFRRSVSLWDEDAGEWLSIGPWQYVEDIHALQPVRFNPDARAVAAPGATLVDPIGLPVFVDADANGVSDGPTTRPASGEQDLDPWTGAPLTDENGNPVLVP